MAVRDVNLLPDGVLLDLYVHGNRDAAQAICGRYRSDLLDLLTRRLRDRDLAEDALQETFCRMLERASWLVNHPRLEGWLCAVARNVSVDVLRRKRVRESALTDPRNTMARAQREESAGPEGKLQSREFNQAILQALRELSEPERRVFLLRTQSTLSFRDIARELSAPLNTVLSRMHRALKHIRAVLAREGWQGRPPESGSGETEGQTAAGLSALADGSDPGGAIRRRGRWT